MASSLFFAKLTLHIMRRLKQTKGVKIMKTLFKTLITVVLFGKTGLANIEDIEAMGVNIA